MKPFRKEFRYFDAFPPDSLLSAWLIGLAMARDDLNDAIGIFLSFGTGRDGAAVDPERAFYALRISCGHVREAVRLILGDGKQKPLRDPQIEAFVASVPEAELCLSQIKALAEPWDSSYVAKLLGPVRNLAFHYDPRLIASRLADLRAREPDTMGAVRVGSTMAGTRYLFAQRLIAGESIGELLTEGAKALQPLVAAITLFADVLLNRHLSLGL